MDEQLCKERRERIETEVKEMQKDIAQLKTEASGFAVEIRNLCKQMESLVATLKWLIGLVIVPSIAFFIYIFQHYIEK